MFPFADRDGCRIRSDSDSLQNNFRLGVRIYFFGFGLDFTLELHEFINFYRSRTGINKRGQPDAAPGFYDFQAHVFQAQPILQGENFLFVGFGIFILGRCQEKFFDTVFHQYQWVPDEYQAEKDHQDLVNVAVDPTQGGVAQQQRDGEGHADEAGDHGVDQPRLGFRLQNFRPGFLQTVFGDGIKGQTAGHRESHIDGHQAQGRLTTAGQQHLYIRIERHQN